MNMSLEDLQVELKTRHHATLFSKLIESLSCLITRSIHLQATVPRHVLIRSHEQQL